MKVLHTFISVSQIAFIVLTLAYLYQIFYMYIGFRYRKMNKASKKAPAKFLNYAVFISARNEEGVIGELIQSLKEQTYPGSKFKIFVLADNCTDQTAEVSRRAGAVVYERFDQHQVGKGYALNYLYHHVIRDYGEMAFDGYFVFDADNILDKNFIYEMNRTFSQGGYDCLTSYRNSKNFGTNWITAGYSIWFLREARYVNFPRHLLGNSCMISGTGFLVSRELLAENRGWPYHLLTEDIEFSVNCAIHDKKIGYVDDAILYDEQPETFAQSWNQRLRWSKGFFQIDWHYIPSLIHGIFTAKRNKASCYDVLMTVAPCSILTIFLLLYNIFLFGYMQDLTIYYRVLLWHTATRSLITALAVYYFEFLFIGVCTVATEWKRIRATSFRKICYIWLFPIFEATYLPITVVALFKKVEWKPIAHYSTEQLAARR